MLDARPQRCWDRAPESLLVRKDSIAGLAIASESRIEACLLYSIVDDGAACRIEFFHAAVPDRSAALLGLLLRHLLAEFRRRLCFVRVHGGEIPFDSLQRWGFTPIGRTIAWVAVMSLP